jgi:hypothetical protein
MKFKKIGASTLLPEVPKFPSSTSSTYFSPELPEMSPSSKLPLLYLSSHNFLQAIDAILREGKDVLQRASCCGGPRTQSRRPTLLYQVPRGIPSFIQEDVRIVPQI